MKMPESSPPLVTVAVPAFNRLDELRECLESVAAQTYRPIEVFVVDDASSEAIEPVVRSVAWPSGIDCHYVRSEVNQGPGGAREIARQRAVGTYISYLDSDDWYAPEFVARQVEALEANPQAVMAYCQSREFTALPITGEEPVWRRSGETFAAILPEVVLYRRPWCVASLMWRREMAAPAGGWTTMPVMEDYEYEVRVGCLGHPIVHVNHPLCFFRRAGHWHIMGEQETRKRENPTQFWAQRQAATERMVASILDSPFATNVELMNAVTLVLLKNVKLLVRADLRKDARIALARVKRVTRAFPPQARQLAEAALLARFLPWRRVVTTFKRLPARPPSR